MGETINEELRLAGEIIESTGMNLFLTGKAGTGKTTFLRNLRNSSSKRMVVLAPTGVAAINAEGSTIHSFFHFPPSPFIPGIGFPKNDKEGDFRISKNKKRLMRNLDLIVIDEISMVRPDLIDAVDAMMRRYRQPHLPFGGAQLLLIGDLRQLPPVANDNDWNILRDYYKSPYFFESHALKKAGFIMVELIKVYRQNDSTFINILNEIRDNRLSSSTLRMLNERASKSQYPPDEDGYIRLTSHNYRADRINHDRLDSLPGHSHLFKAKITGKFPESSYPADASLELKVGAQVMFIKNDPSGNQQYYNGMLGVVTALSDRDVTVFPLQGGKNEITLGRAEWLNNSFQLISTGEIKEVTEGSFSQIPLRLAWAITIHKSQGLTFDKAIIDAAYSFAPGQTYVALSRCRSLEGLLLESPIPSSAIMTDDAVSKFISAQAGRTANIENVGGFKEAYYARLLLELFNFLDLAQEYDAYYRAVIITLGKDFPTFTDKAAQFLNFFNSELIHVGERMQNLLIRNLPLRLSDPEIALLLRNKISGGAEYFSQHLQEYLELVSATPLNIDNRILLKRLTLAKETLLESLIIRISLLNHFVNEEFDPGNYLKYKTKIILDASKSKQKGATLLIDKKVKKSGIKSEFEISTTDIANPGLYNRLTEWRMEKAAGKPCFTILSNKTLKNISTFLPHDLTDLMAIPGIGRKKISEFGEDIISIVKEFIHK